ncbi:MAG: DUF1566 domain-containing protein [Crocinitomicaceae bacterium]
MILIVSCFSCGKDRLPVVDIFEPDEINPNSAIIRGFVFDPGKKELLSRGICFGLNSIPSKDDNYVESNSPLANDEFSCELINLLSDTVYYARAYGTNKLGTSYSEYQISFKTEYTIGGRGPAQGVVFYLDGNGGGMEVSMTDVGSGIPWGCEGLDIPATSNTSVGTGESNTLAIVSNCIETGIAAKVCVDYIYQGFDDWYLPSRDELSLIYENVYLMGKGNFSSSPPLYWSSSSVDSDNAHRQLFSTGEQLPYFKSSSVPMVRAVRSF